MIGGLGDLINLLLLFWGIFFAALSSEVPSLWIATAILFGALVVRICLARPFVEALKRLGLNVLILFALAIVGGVGSAVGADFPLVFLPLLVAYLIYTIARFVLRQKGIRPALEVLRDNLLRHKPLLLGLSVTFVAILVICGIALIWSTYKQVGEIEEAESKSLISREQYVVQTAPKELEGCVFWSRHDSLETQERWKEQFQRDSQYCNSRYDQESVNDASNPFEGLFEGEYADPRCTYDAFKKQKRDENWNYLVSNQKDDYYYSCIERLFPKKTASQK